MHLTQLLDLARSGRLLPFDSLKRGRNSPWEMAHSVAGLMPAVAAPMPFATMGYPATMPVQYPTPPSQPAVAAPTVSANPPVTKAIVTPAPAPKPSVAPPPQPAASTPAPVPPAATPASPPPEGSLNSPAPPAPVLEPNSGPRPIYRPDMNRPKKSPSTAKGKKPKQGGGIELGALLKYVRVRGGLGAVAGVALLVVGWNLLPESTGKFREPYKKVVAVFKDFDEKVKSKSVAGTWKEFGDATKKKLQPLEQELNAINSGHVVKERLKTAITTMKNATSLSKVDEAEPKLSVIQKNLDEAGKVLGL